VGEQSGLGCRGRKERRKTHSKEYHDKGGHERQGVGRLELSEGGNGCKKGNEDSSWSSLRAGGEMLVNG